jgi:hypothetical protein
MNAIKILAIDEKAEAWKNGCHCNPDSYRDRKK